MGRLRDGYESPLFRGINEEVMDLFGNDDGSLYRFDEEESEKTRDPLWDEPEFKATYEKFKLPFIIQDWSTPIDISDAGGEALYQATIFISRNHLTKSFVPQDQSGKYIRPGDIFETWAKGNRMFWWITGVDQQGFLNDTDSWTQYVLTCRRTHKFAPEREL